MEYHQSGKHPGEYDVLFGVRTVVREKWNSVYSYFLAVCLFLKVKQLNHTWYVPGTLYSQINSVNTSRNSTINVLTLSHKQKKEDINDTWFTAQASGDGLLHEMQGRVLDGGIDLQYC